MRGSLAGKAGEGGDGGDGIGMARTRKGGSKLSVPWDREYGGDGEGARGCALAVHVPCELETLSWRTSSSECVFCFGGPRGLGSGISFPSSGWALVNVVKGLGSRGQPNSLTALLVLPSFGFNTVNMQWYLTV